MISLQSVITVVAEWLTLLTAARLTAWTLMMTLTSRRRCLDVVVGRRHDSCVACSYKHTKFGANQSKIGWDIPFCVFFKTAAAAILNFQKVTFWTLDDTCTARIYKHTKFGANWSRIGRDMFFCVFFKMAAAAILNFQKVRFWTLDDNCIARI